MLLQKADISRLLHPKHRFLGEAHQHLSAIKHTHVRGLKSWLLKK